MATPVLYHIEVSHYNEKARWALDYKGIPHVRKAPPPMFHTAWAFAMTRSATFPVLKMNGDTIGDSTRIIEALERGHPEPPLYPSGPAERARALELEEFFDEELAPHIRRALFAEVTRDREAFAWVAAPTAGRAVHAGFKATAALAGPLLRMRYGIKPDTAEQGWEKTYAAMDRLESELDGREYLVGDGFTVADLTAAALFFPLVRPDEAAVPVAGAAARGAGRAARSASPRARGSSGCRRCTAATAASPPKCRRSSAVTTSPWDVSRSLFVLKIDHLGGGGMIRHPMEAATGPKPPRRRSRSGCCAATSVRSRAGSRWSRTTTPRAGPWCARSIRTPARPGSPVSPARPGSARAR